MNLSTVTQVRTPTAPAQSQTSLKLATKTAQEDCYVAYNHPQTDFRRAG